MEQLILEIISSCVKHKKTIRRIQHAFTKEKPCLANLLTFYNEKSGLVDEVKAVEIVCFGFSKAFYDVSPNTLIEKLLICGLDEQ